MTTPIINSIQIAQPRTYGDPAATDPFQRPWTTAFYKEPVAGPLQLKSLGLIGDGQADLHNHGGIDKAVCAYSLDHYDDWRNTHNMREMLNMLNLPDLPHGAFGENFSIDHLDETGVCIGDVWAVGDVADWDTAATGAIGEERRALAPRVHLQVSQPRQPCWKLARRWGLKTLTAQVAESGRTGWYFRVLVEGTVAAGMPLTLLERPCPEWTIARCNDLMYRDRHNREAIKKLAYLPQLSASWRDHFMGRLGELA